MYIILRKTLFKPAYLFFNETGGQTSPQSVWQKHTSESMFLCETVCCSRHPTIKMHANICGTVSVAACNHFAVVGLLEETTGPA